MKTRKPRTLLLLAVILLLGAGISVGADDTSDQGIKNFAGGFKVLVKTMPENTLLASSNAVGAPAYHRHLVRPGLATSYLLRLQNKTGSALTITLEIPEVPANWNATLDEKEVKLDPGAVRFIKLNLSPSANLAPGSVAAVKVSAKANDKSEELTLEAETTAKRKMYIISLDSFGPEYLDLNSSGTGPGKEGDWLTPNLHALVKDGVLYNDHLAHLISATDMNHGVYLSGAYPGRLGIYSVQVFMFGFDAKGKPIMKGTPLDIMYWGKDRKPVTTVFNVAKDPQYGGNAKAFTAYISGKAWVPEHYRNPIFGLDRIVTADDRPDYVTPTTQALSRNMVVRAALKMRFVGKMPAGVMDWEDNYTVDQTIEVINNEDPDVSYILFASPDSAGHIYGAAYDVNEWNTNGTPNDLTDDISKVNSHANRAAMIQSVKNTDVQLGRLIDFLKKRGAYNDSYVAIEADHNMETNNYESLPLGKILKESGYTDKHDYYILTLSQMGMVFLRHNDPKIVPALERELESYRITNPLTGQIESPMIVLTREEMATGIDKATGKKVALPGELYSEYYIEHSTPDGMKWPDMLLLANKYYQFPIVGVGLANLGVAFLPFDLPAISFFVGGHGSISTQHSLMSIRGPGIPAGKAVANRTYASDLAPTLYRLEGYKIPECVQGKGLPKADPTMR